LKSGRWTPVAAGLLAALLVRADMQEWVQHLPSGDWLKVFFRSVALPDGAVEARRPPAQTRPALGQLISANPNQAELYRLRAHEDELQLDFVAAEADWRQYVRLAKDQGAAWLDLADYFDRRYEPTAEVDALRIVGRLASDPFAPVKAQRSWMAFERALRVVHEQALPDASAVAIYRAWVARYPRETSVRQALVEYAIQHDLNATAEQEIAAYKKAFLTDNIYPVKAAADLAMNRGSAADALALYDREFQPLWPDELAASYFKLLEDSSEARAMVGKTRAALQQNPNDYPDAGRLFLYWRQQNNLVAARRVLEEYRVSKQALKDAWKPDELYTVARLYEKLPDAAQAAELYYTLYSLSSADGYYVEQALTGLANLLLTNPEQPTRYGAGDLAFYKDIATMDRSPGFLNGIFSLILNGTGPRWEYAREDSASTAYFHRAAAEELVVLLDRRFPQSASRAPLHAALIQAYGAYGDDDTVISRGRQFLTAFPRAAGRMDVALAVADALARRHREREEFALYDQLLGESARRADGVPVGANSGQPRSADYQRVLDRYLARLTALDRPLDAVRLYRNEIARNPNDPGLYERLATFLDQNHLTAETEAVYKQAIAKFNSRGWYEKLARWYLRQEERADVGNITHQIIDIFSGTELERYFSDIVTDENVGPILYRQMNLYALQRFPEDLVFVRNLLSAYSAEVTRDDAAAMRLLRQYWYYDAGLRNRYFAALTKSGTLESELASVRASNPDMQSNPAAVQFRAEAEAWRSHFEEAAPRMKAIAEAFPGDRAFTSRASSIYRSIATVDPNQTATAVALARLEFRSDPRDRETLAKIGDIYADRERFAPARPVWDAMPATAPGDVNAWRETATVFWDYYLYADALRVIRTARVRFDDDSLLAYEAGAIYEGERHNDLAAAQYLEGYLAGDDRSERRLLRLARQAATRNVVDRLTAEAADRPDAEWNAISLRVQILQQQQRSGEIAPLLLAKIASTRSTELLRQIQETAGNDLAEVHQRAIEREIAVTQDPLEQARQRIALVRFLESRKDAAAANQAMESLLRERPDILGVVRGAVDYYTRTQQPQQAIRVLVASAGRANESYRSLFTLEAANLATGAHDFARARELLQPLLQRDPYRSEYLAAMAATYLQAGDDKGFRDFELATIKSLRLSTLPAAERTARIAAMRRDLIPALTRLGDFAGAVDQYIEVIDAYPEDEGLIREASLYASRHALGTRIVDFYRNTILQAPSDYRWPMVLARVETALEDFPAAISAYGTAVKERPDRKDLLAAREALEERTLQFDRALASCQTLYELSYHAPEWMLKSATLEARLGRREDAVRDLIVAEIGEHKETVQSLMTVAQQLDLWNYEREAVDFAERARKTAGAKGAFTEGFDANLWARILVRGRRFDEVLAQDAALPTAGATVRQYYTPEEKAAVEAKVRNSSVKDKLEFAESAEFTELQSELLKARLSKPDVEAERKLVTLEDSRARFAELGAILEAYAARHAGDSAVGNRPLIEAEKAYKAAGDSVGELRVLGQLYRRGDLQNRYLALLDRADRDQIVAIARNSNPAVAYAVRSGDFGLAQRALQAREAVLLWPVWGRAYTALAGVYDGVQSSTVDAAFHTALGGGTIGERVRSHPDPKKQIVGSTWFYYGARYGEYLERAGAGNASLYLPATLEEAPGNPNAYFSLGAFYEERGKANQAIEEYEAVLQLDPDRGAAENAIARILWRQNHHDDAVARWRAALAAFYRVENRGARVPEDFWNGVTATVEEIGQAKQLNTLRPDIEKLLRAYININGGYRSDELLSAAVRACFESGEDFGWVLALAENVEWLPDQILNGLAMEFHLSAEQQEQIARLRITVAIQQASQVVGASHDEGEGQVLQARLHYIDLLLEHGKTSEAQQAWNAVPREQRQRPGMARTTELRLAAANGTAAQLLARYRAEPATAPPQYELPETADYLRRHNHVDAARAILEFYYQQAIEEQNVAANFLGLAGVYLEEGQVDRAVQLLRRMNLVSGEEFDTFVPAATLLGEHGHAAEAILFLRDRVKAVPWDSAARLQLARLLNVDERRSVTLQLVRDGDAVYRDRATAARLVADPATDVSTELGLLQHPTITPAGASEPFYVEARVVAGLYREALAICPSDEHIRVETLRAALAASQDSLAIALASRMRQGPEFLAGSGLSKPVRAEIARDVAKAYQRESDIAGAINYSNIAVRLGLDLKALEEQLKAEQTRELENAQRAPQIHDNIDQNHVVKPRLTGRPS
jgi:thioredoxin-like negative regulator of GroEL